MDTCQEAATSKRMIANGGDTNANSHTRHVATIERIIANTGNSIRKHNARFQGSAKTECIIPNAGHAIRNVDTGQFGAPIECVIANTGNTIANHNSRNILTPFIPWYSNGRRIIIHIPRTRDCQYAIFAPNIFRQYPGQVVSTNTICHHPGNSATTAQLYIGCPSCIFHRIVSHSHDIGEYSVTKARGITLEHNLL